MEQREPSCEQAKRVGLWYQRLRSLKLMAAHAILFTFALLLAFLVREEMRIDETWFPVTFLSWLVPVLIVKLVVFGLLHQYHGWWRYVSISDLFTIMTGAFLSTLTLVLGYYVVANIRPIWDVMGPLREIPQAVMLLDWAATIVVVCGVRVAIRLYYEETHQEEVGQLSRLLVVGAGNAGEVLVREIHRREQGRYEVVGFVDDDVRKQGVRIHGVRVLGTTEQIKQLADELNVDEIAIAMPSATHRQMRQVIQRCEGTALRFSTVPDLVEIASGRVSVSQMRNVDINDLLGREPVQLDLQLIEEFVRGKVVMITGAGGSIGSEMCRQVGQFNPKQLVLVEQAENALFYIERELTSRFETIDIQAVICDIVDTERVDRVFHRYRPEVVIHAAAHKHVPLMELNPGEAIKNNVVGTRSVAQAADRHGAAHFVMISTDKAVNPTSIMGSTKRLAEMVIQCLNRRSKTDFVMVRFGNVLGSNGSVIPLFRQQIEAGGPVTVTHPEMRRYFMTIPEASQLVLQAATMGNGGEVFVLDMGEPVKIVDLARDLVTLSGFRPGEDIEVVFTGMRPGEKLFEELATTGENMMPTRHAKISIWKNDPPDEPHLNEAIGRLVKLADRAALEEIVETLKEIVPEYVGDVDSLELHEQYTAQNGGGDAKAANANEPD